MSYHGGNGMSALAARIGIAGARRAIFELDGCGDQLKNMMVAVFGIHQQVRQGNMEQTDIDGCDSAHAAGLLNESDGSNECGSAVSLAVLRKETLQKSAELLPPPEFSISQTHGPPMLRRICLSITGPATTG